MKRKDYMKTLKGIGDCLLYAVLVVGGFLAVLFLIKWGVNASAIIMPYIDWANGLAFLICLLVFTPLSFFSKTRGFAGVGFFIVSFIFGLSLWLSGFLITYAYWGIGGVVIGTFLMGIGVVATAIIALLLHAEWVLLGITILNVALVLGVRILGTYLIEKSEQDSIKVIQEKLPKYCPNCSEENIKEAKFCRSCGFELSGG